MVHELTRMKRWMCRNKGNLMLEYLALITIVVVALLCMHFYITQAICGRWRLSADVFGGGRQYAPNVTRISR